MRERQRRGRINSGARLRGEEEGRCCRVKVAGREGRESGKDDGVGKGIEEGHGGKAEGEGYATVTGDCARRLDRVERTACFTCWPRAAGGAEVEVLDALAGESRAKRRLEGRQGGGKSLLTLGERAGSARELTAPAGAELGVERVRTF